MLNVSTTKLQEEIVMGLKSPFWAGMLSFGGSGYRVQLLRQFGVVDRILSDA